ncbi:cytochrome b/b6 domain-containing protein [Phenylobacterium sp.]|jgi:cytochrome b561/polyisoprenoid-binding protein YceI|uniref:cytochrome b/b6 domain-containing protein n=1 Tax=Phenylobacterium sp. TaxID=1871053 RepID=UPI002F3F7E97
MTASAPAGRDRYSTVAIVLHWLIAAAIVFQVLLAWRMGGPMNPATFAVTQLHKSIGVTILALSLVRLGWRLANPPPPQPPTLAGWERALSKITHIGFYVIMIGMPLTGWIMVSASRLHIPTVLYGAIPWPDLPGMAGASRPVWNKIGHNGHEWLGWGLYVLLALHVAGALKHQLFARDEPILARMAPGAAPGRWLEPRLLAIVAAFLAIAALGWTVHPPPPGMAAPPGGADHDHDEDHDHDAGDRAVAAPAAPSATPAAPAAPAPEAAKAGPAAPAELVRWAVGPGSTLGFSTTWGGATVQGRFKTWTADVLFSPEALDRSKVTVSIDVGSVDTGDVQRDMALPSGDWFDAPDHPKATFTATRFEKTGEGRFIAHGRLSLRGVEKPVNLPFRLQIDGDKARVRGVTSLDRTAFGVGQGEWTSTDQIPAQVSVSVDLKATKR